MTMGSETGEATETRMVTRTREMADMFDGLLRRADQLKALQQQYCAEYTSCDEQSKRADALDAAIETFYEDVCMIRERCVALAIIIEEDAGDSWPQVSADFWDFGSALQHDGWQPPAVAGEAL